MGLLRSVFWSGKELHHFSRIRKLEKKSKILTSYIICYRTFFQWEIPQKAFQSHKKIKHGLCGKVLHGNL